MTINTIKHLALSLWEDFTTKRVMNAAYMLTYSTLLAIVPVAAVIFAIARGFGYNRYIESWFRNTFDSHPQVIEAMIGFVNSYLVHTQSGVVFGIGLVFMLYTVLMLTRNIEQAFNDIWNVRQQRDFFRSTTNYLTMFFLMPILIIVMSGLTLWASSIIDILDSTFGIGTFLKYTIRITPFFVLMGIITLLYIFMPNTRVRWRNAILPALGASIALELLQYFYVHSQVWVSNYNAIYGSFAALPLFMLWLQFTWTIILIGAELSYTEQNVEEFRVNYSPNIAIRYRYLLSAVLLSRICHRFHKGKKAYNISELKEETHLPMRIINELVYDMTEANLITESYPTSNNMHNETVLLPAESVENITLGMMISRLESIHPWISEKGIELSSLFANTKWATALKNRSHYLDTQDDIKLYELC